MAERYAVASGEYNNPAIWDGGTVPAFDDVVRPNSFDVTITSAVQAAQLRRDASGPAVAGGRFLVSSGLRQIIAELLATLIVENDASLELMGNITGLGTTSLDHRSSGHVEVNGNATGSATGTSSRGIIFQALDSGSLTVNGNLYGGTGHFANQGLIVQPPIGGETEIGTRNVIVNGDSFAEVSHGLNVNGRSQVVLMGSSYAKNNSGTIMGGDTANRAGTHLMIYGNLHGSEVADEAFGLLYSAQYVASLTVYGQIIGRRSRGLQIAELVAQSTINLHGGANGGYLASGIGLRHLGSSPVFLAGNAVGGSHPQAHAISNEGSAIINVGGRLITNPSGAGIANTGSGAINLGVTQPPSVHRFVTTAVTPRSIIGSWVINGKHIPVDSLTVDVKDFSFNSLIGGPQAMTRDTTDTRLVNYQHGSNVFSRNNQYFLIFGGSYDGQALEQTIQPIRF